ncbi:hypothetical protein ALC57_07311 [Trachymyrmex cornetzi]|uniref:Uncharacterized protein n=1 Tax=Trachymyrmex cornetzi TaxID=471704 RepID=A0A195E5P5_9HYME|nr:hypothetical protein ALC57_07311 [Trachymyrmex cornetzi]
MANKRREASSRGLDCPGERVLSILGGIWSTSASLSIHPPIEDTLSRPPRLRLSAPLRLLRIPVSSRVTSIIRLECRRNKWSNHPPTPTIWRKQSSTAIHPYIVARTKSLATADLRYALYINQPPPVPPPSRDYTHPKVAVYTRPLRKGFPTSFFRLQIAPSGLIKKRKRKNETDRVVERSYEAVGKTVTRGYASCYAWVGSCRTAAANQVIDPLSVRSREFGVQARLKNLSTSRMGISQTPCCVRDSQRQSRSRLLSYRAIVRGRFDKLPNNCQMLENDEIESDFGARTSEGT